MNNLYEQVERESILQIISISEYFHDNQDTRIIKKEYADVTLQKTVYSPSDNYETTMLASNSVTKNTTYYYASNQLIAEYLYDYQGNRLVKKEYENGSLEQTKYDPWGEVKSGGTKSKYLYTGQEKDLETGLNYYNARYYNSHIKRFTQPDDIIQNIYNPQSLNRYSYVLNNPLRYTDPTGHCVGFLTPFCGQITSFATRIIQPVSNMLSKIITNPNTSKVTQLVSKAQSNPAVVNTGPEASKETIKAARLLTKDQLPDEADYISFVFET